MRTSLLIIMTSLAIALSACQPSSETTSEKGFASPYFTVETFGEGPNVILVPGLASSTAVWDGTVAALRDDYTVHAVQVSGFGGAAPRGNASNDNVLDDLGLELARYAASLDGQTQMVGHSLGGLVTMKAALSENSPLDAIVIVDVLPFFSVLMDENATAESIAPIAGMMKATLLAQNDDIFANSQDEALKALVKGDENRALALSWSVATDRAVMAQAMSEVLVTDLRENVTNLDIPVTVIYARDPDIPNMETVEAFYQTLYAPIRDVRLEPADNTLHFIMLDAPDVFHDLLKNALKP